MEFFEWVEGVGKVRCHDDDGQLGKGQVFADYAIARLATERIAACNPVGNLQVIAPCILMEESGWFAITYRMEGIIRFVLYAGEPDLCIRTIHVHPA